MISACLLGRACRFDGGDKADPAVLQRVEAARLAGAEIVAVCPEELGGLGTPRPAAELRGGDGEAVLAGRAPVVTVEGNVDVTAAFVDGAQKAAALAEGASEAILKARSPSCGVGQTHVDGAVQEGDGVFAALLRRGGVPIQSDQP